MVTSGTCLVSDRNRCFWAKQAGFHCHLLNFSRPLARLLFLVKREVMSSLWCVAGTQYPRQEEGLAHCRPQEMLPKSPQRINPAGRALHLWSLERTCCHLLTAADRG